MYTGNLYCELNVARDVALEKEKKRKKKKKTAFFSLSFSFSTLFFSPRVPQRYAPMLREIQLRGSGRIDRNQKFKTSGWAKERAYRERG